MSPELRELVQLYQRWLHLPDPAAVLAVLGTIQANRLAGDPVWLLLVAPSSWGKSEILCPTESLPFVYPVGGITEAGLLSGSSRSELDENSTGGLLLEIGDLGIIMCKDFGSILNMHSEKRQTVLAALREVYDGKWTRVLGTDGGKTISWRGKVGFLGACTESIERHQRVMSLMGERFILCRVPRPDEEAQALAALENASEGDQMRDQLAKATATLFRPEPPQPEQFRPSPVEARWLVSMAILIARCRSSVERDGYSRDIELIPGSEAPARIVKVLAQFRLGLLAIGLEAEEVPPLVRKIAFDCIPTIRRLIVEWLVVRPDAVETKTAIATALGYPATTIRRHLEELAAHGVLRRMEGGSGKADGWTLSESARTRLAAVNTVPEVSGKVGRLSVPEESDTPCPAPVPEVSQGVPASTSLSSSSKELRDISGTVLPSILDMCFDDIS